MASAAVWPVSVSTTGKPTRIGGSPDCAQAHHSAGRLDDIVDGRPVARRAGLAIAGDGTIDQVRVDRLRRFMTKPDRPLPRAGIFEQYVAARDQLAGGFERLRLFEIEADGFLAGVHRDEAGAIPS